MDDCSNDKTIKIVENCISKDSRIKLISLKENSGSAVARNTGIKVASGDYITFLDGDDLWFSNFIETSLSFSIKENSPFVFSSYKRLDEELNPLLSDYIVPRQVNYYDILLSNPISCLTAFINVKQLGKKYMPNIRKRQDVGLWASYLKEGIQAMGIQEVMAIYRMRKNSLSRNKMSLIKYQWFFYYKIEKLGVFRSIYYLINWAFRGYLKYRQ